ncbi:MAG: sulfite exporter TauE/SafE family protein [Pseudomonadota bacterium]
MAESRAVRHRCIRRKLLISVLFGALLGGFVLGLTGFGNGPTAYGVWLHFLSPQISAPLAAIGSVVGHLVMFRGFRHAMLRDRILPLIVGGLAGVPLGVWILTIVPADTFRVLAGMLLAAYSMVSLGGGHRIQISGETPKRDMIAGFLGGICGGLASLSGPIVTIWSGLKNWSPDEQRAAYQPYNFAILSAAFVGFGAAGLLTWELAYVAALTLPMTLFGVLCGKACYGFVDAGLFRRIVLILLTVSGCALILRGV